MRNEEMFFFFKPPRTNQRREPPYLPVNWMARWPLEEVHRCPATNLIFFPVFFWCGGGGRPPSPPSEDDMIYLFPSPGCVPPHFSRVSASAKLEEIGDWSIECVCVCVCVWVCLGCVTVCVCVCIGVAPAPRRLLGWKLDRGRSRRTKKKGKNTNKKIK